MTHGVDEVQAAMHTVVLNVPTVQPRFISQICVVPLVHKVNDGLPAAKVGKGLKEHIPGERRLFRSPRSVVYSVAKAGGIDHGQTQLDTLLFYVHSGGIDGHSLLDAVYNVHTQGSSRM